ncbi:MAG: glycine--tRNA ligase subunit beta [Paracoccaceae bacterium]
MMDLLIELFSEEVPARMQPRARADLQRLMTDALVEAGLTYASAAAFSTPRRLTLTVEGLTARSPDRVEERKGPKEGAPDKAVEGFARGAGVARDALELRETPKGRAWFATVRTAGRAADAIVAEALEATIRDFPWPKSMRWGTGSLRWVRPLRRILCILSDEGGARVVPLSVDGIEAADLTEGHRFMAPGAFAVTGFEDYEAKLKRARVMLRADERADAIRDGIAQRAFALGLGPVPDEGLLEEVAGLVEWPVPLIGAIAQPFLDLPPEVLRTSMKEHQKFFSLTGRDGRITHYATVANIEAPDDGAAILAGNGRVLSARLSDAAFFWTNDLAVADAGMGPWLDKLGSVTFHAKLGTQAERIERIAALAAEIAPAVGADPEQARTAARLAKADLASEMVYEFPELQGVMGRYYVARTEGPDVAAVAQEHYQPLGPSDDVPSAPLSVAVALAEKLDTLAGFWAIDEKPTGSKDPYALRRAALGVIRLVVENGHAIELAPILDAAIAGNGGVEGQTSLTLSVLSFLHDRLKVFLRDRGVRHDVIDACLAMPNSDDLSLLTRRATALQAFLDTEDGENLVLGWKRADRLLAQAEEADGVEYSFGPDPKLAHSDEERAVFAALDAAEPRIAVAMGAQDFGAAMTAMAGLRGPIDAFFDAVQINADEQVLRRNRLNLLHRIRQATSGVADLSRLSG